MKTYEERVKALVNAEIKITKWGSADKKNRTLTQSFVIRLDGTVLGDDNGVLKFETEKEAQEYANKLRQRLLRESKGF